MDEKEQIRRAYLLDGKSQRQIAQEQQHSRNSVVVAIADPSTGTYHLTEPRPSPVMATFKSLVDEWLRADATAPKKQRHTAHRVYKRLVEEHHFAGAESTVRRYVRLRRPELQGGDAFVLLEYAPGQEAQCDFGEVEVLLNEQRWPIETFYQDGKTHLGLDEYRMRDAEAIQKHWCLVFVAYSLLHLDCLPASLNKSRLPIKTIGEACRQQGQALIEALILHASQQLEQGKKAQDVFAYLFAKQQVSAMV